MPPKRAQSADGGGSKRTSSAKAGGAKKKKSVSEGQGQINDAAGAQISLETMVQNVPIANPFVGVLSDRGSAIYSMAVAEPWGLPPSSSTANLNSQGSGASAADERTSPSSPPSSPSTSKLVLTGSHNGVITVMHCAPRPSVARVGGRTAESSSDFGSSSPYAFPSQGRADAQGLDSADAAASAGLGSVRLLPPEDAPKQLYTLKTQTLAAHKNSIKQLMVIDDLGSVAGKNGSERLRQCILPSAKIAATAAVGGEAHSEAIGDRNTNVSSQVLLSCSTDGSIKLWSLPNCMLTALYTTKAAEAYAARKRVLAQQGPVMAVDRARAVLGDGVSKTTTFLTDVPPELKNEVNHSMASTSATTSPSSQSGSPLVNINNNNNADGDGGDDNKTSTFAAVCLGPEGSNRMYAVDDEGYLHTWEIIPSLANAEDTEPSPGPTRPPPSSSLGNAAAKSRENVPTILPIMSLKVHRGRATALAVPVIDPLLFPNGPHPSPIEVPKPSACVITVGDEGVGKLINLETRSVSALYVCESTGGSQYAETEPATSVVYRHPNVIIGCADGTIQVFDALTAARVAIWQGHTDRVNRLVLSKPFFSGATTAVPPPPVIKVLSKKQLQKLAMQGKAPPPPPKPVVHEQLPCEGHLLISCGDDRSIALWDCTSWTPVFYFSSPSASLSRYRRPMSAQFESSSAFLTRGGAAVVGMDPSDADNRINRRVGSVNGGVFNVQPYADTLSENASIVNGTGGAAPLHHRHNISDVALVTDEASLSDLALQLLAAANASNAAATVVAGSATRGNPLQSVLTPLTHTGSRGGGGVLLSACFGGKVLMWDFYSIVSSLDQRKRIGYNAEAVEKAKARSLAIAERNKQNQRGGGKR